MALTRITKGVIKPNENYDTHDINSTGIITATGLNVSGNASIGGVLTYEDVTNIDSIGIITARSDIKVGTGVTLTSAGAGFYAGIVTASNFVKADGSEVGFSPDAQENLVAGTNAASNFSGTSPEYNTLIGYQAGKGITSGDRNVAIGRNAMASTDYGSGGLTGTDNVAIGANAFSQRTGDASNNVFIGSGNIAYRCQSGDNNIGIGQYTYYYLTSGSNNIALGQQALDYSDTGNANIAIGPSALTELTGGNNNNTAIGAYVGTSLQNGSNNTLIGNSAQASAQTVSNEITLGNNSINHLRVPGIGVSFSTNGNHITGITTFKDRIKLGNSGNGELYYSGGIKMVSTAQIELESANQMYLKAQSSGLFLFASNQEVVSVYGGSGGGVYFRHNNTQKLKLESGNWTYQGSATVTFDNHLYASSDSAIDIGTNSVRFRNIYADTLYGDGSNLTGISGGVVTLDSYNNLFGGTDAGASLNSSSYDNVLFGQDAGDSITSGYENVCIGLRAGQAITDTRRNTCVGADAGRNFNAGDSTFIGWNAGSSASSNGNVCIGHNTAGEANGNDTAVGYSCGPTGSYSGNTNVCYGFAAGNGLRQSATRNTIIGPGAGRNASSGQVNIEGSHNIIIGDEASLSSTTVSNECVIGAIDGQSKAITKFRIPGINFVLKDNGGTPTQGHVLTVDANGEASFAAASGGGGSVSSDSAENTIGGSDAGLNLNTSSSYRNTLFGYQAGEQINSGDDNTCIGWKAADKLTNGSKNVAVGSEALEYITGGSDNVAIGWEAGRSLGSGQGNTMIGNMAGRSMSGNDNIAIGDHAYSNGGGTRSIGIGGESVWLGGTDVIGIGQYTMARGNSQIGGIGIGYQAGRNNAGDYNVYLGYQSGYGTGSSPYAIGNYNIGLGYKSLYSVTSASSNVAIGSSAGDVLTTGLNNIILGDGADASSATVSNEITLGNSSITKFRIPGLNSFEISDAGVMSGTASAATSANGFRNVTVSTASPSGGSDGDVWIKYS